MKYGVFVMGMKANIHFEKKITFEQFIPLTIKIFFSLSTNQLSCSSTTTGLI